MQKINIIKLGFFLFVSSVAIGNIFILMPATAIDNEVADLNIGYNLYIDQPTIAKGYTVTAFNGNIKLSLVPGILDEATNVELIRLAEELDWPWQLDRISPVYQFEFLNKNAYDDHKPFYIQLNYDENNNYKQVYFYDKNYATWRPLPTKDFPAEKFVRSLIHLPYARIAVFSYPEIPITGSASWYSYKSGNFAASPDLPKGSRLRVKRKDNDKYIDVEINDFGPDRVIFPGRVIDLEKNAFVYLAPLGAGTIEVEIQPLAIVPDSDGRILGIPGPGAPHEPDIGALAAVVMREDNNYLLWQKHATATLPLASLTKMVAIKVFLDTRPSLNLVVTYSDQDAEYNYQHVDKWESAHLSIEEGDTLTVEDLVYASLVASANNTVETLVRVSGLKRQDFIDSMNSSVVEWGASSTNFVEPTGLAPENVSSALDYAIISKEVLKHPIIAKASTMAEYRVTTTNNNKSRLLKNTNKIISINKFNINGSKTGYLDEAGYCLMTRAAAKNGVNIITVTLGSPTRDMNITDTKDLVLYGLRIID